MPGGSYFLPALPSFRCRNQKVSSSPLPCFLGVTSHSRKNNYVDEANTGSVFSQMFSSGLVVRTVGFVISTGGETAGGTLCRQQPAREEKYHVRCEVPPEVNPSRRRTGKPTTNSPFRSWKLQTGRGEVSVEHDTAARLTRPSCNLHETDRKLRDNMEAA
jgi:hypothetical protein